jgi:hypothetical protein
VSARLASYFGSYLYVMWFGMLLGIGSYLCRIVFVIMDKVGKKPIHHHQVIHQQETKSSLWYFNFLKILIND